MWFVVMTMVGGAQASDGTIDCSLHDDPACEAAQARLATIAEALSALDCDKGRKKKREECRADKAALELEKAELTTRWAPPAPPAPAATRGVETDLEMGEEEVEKMEIDVSDE